MINHNPLLHSPAPSIFLFSSIWHWQRAGPPAQVLDCMNTTAPDPRLSVNHRPHPPAPLIFAVAAWTGAALCLSTCAPAVPSLSCQANAFLPFRGQLKSLSLWKLPWIKELLYSFPCGFLGPAQSSVYYRHLLIVCWIAQCRPLWWGRCRLVG